MIQNTLLLKMYFRSLTLNSSSLPPPPRLSRPSCLSSLRSMKEKITNVSRPISSSTAQDATGRTTVAGAMSASHGEMEKMAKTPTRAMAISSPMARAISLPSNHLAMAFDTVMPAISMPQPKIIKPSDASLAEAGNEVHHEPSHVSMPEPANESLTA